MSKILFVNACVRGEESRTLQLCREYLDGKDKVEEVDLIEKDIRPFSGEMVARRTQLQNAGKWDDAIFDLSRQFSEADEIVIGAPYWDLSFPSVLKVYIDHVSVSDIVFRLTDEGKYEGLCKAKHLTLISTSGGFVSEEEDYGHAYLCGIAKMFGIPEVRYVIAGGLDIIGMDIEAQLDKARAELKQLG